MANGWHNKHISTKWGIAVLGWLLVSVVLLIPVLGRNEDLRSHASTESTYSCPSNRVVYEMYKQPVKCVAYVKRIDNNNWACSNIPSNAYDYKSWYNKLLANCYNFGSNVVNGHSKCKLGYHLYSGVKQSAAKAYCVKNKYI